jgi:transcriptional regulator with XRE-family HTH domain
VSTSRVASLGDYLRDQRRAAELSLRELARETGVSNPYLSQVERGLRKPSAEVLNKIAGALQISAEHLFVQAGLLDETPVPRETTESVINADPALTARQRRALLDVYAAFVAQNSSVATPGSSRSTTETGVTDPLSGAAPGTAEHTEMSPPVPVGTPT